MQLMHSRETHEENPDSGNVSSAGLGRSSLSSGHPSLLLRRPPNFRLVQLSGTKGTEFRCFEVIAESLNEQSLDILK